MKKEFIQPTMEIVDLKERIDTLASSKIPRIQVIHQTFDDTPDFNAGETWKTWQ